jgi:hypothetical protein
MKRCVICGQESLDFFFVGNICENCFRELGDKVCCICGRTLEENEEWQPYWNIGLSPDGRIHGKVCSDCARREDVIRCADCEGLIMPEDIEDTLELREPGTGRPTGERVCSRCRGYYYICGHCGRPINIRTEYHFRDSTGRVLCERCRSHYFICEGCRRFIPACAPPAEVIIQEENNSILYYCSECANRNDDHEDDNYDDDYDDYEDDYDDDYVINRYRYKPRPIFHLFPCEEFNPNSQLFFGVELEVDEGGEYHENARYIIEGGYPDFLYAKRDGSLADGFEIVSHPATLAFHLIEAGWDEVLRRAEKLGYTSHDNARCGLHVHVDRDFWGESVQDQEIGELKLLIFFERFWNEIVKFSRRTQRQIEKYCARYETENLETAKRRNGDCRYFALNFQNSNTIEIRIFRGTLKLQTFFATLEFVHHLCYYLKEKTPQELQRITWGNFVNSIPEWMVELREYLKIRNLLTS